MLMTEKHLKSFIHTYFSDSLICLTYLSELGLEMFRELLTLTNILKRLPVWENIIKIEMENLKAPLALVGKHFIQVTKIVLCHISAPFFSDFSKISF